MNKLTKLLLVPAFFLLVSTSAIYSQPKTTFSRGKIVMANSSTRSGLIWISSTADGGQIVYFKATDHSISEKLSPSELISVSFSEGNEIYRTVDLLIDGTPEKVLLQVLFIGEYELLAYYSNKIVQFFLLDTEGNMIPLKNSFTNPDRSNNYSIQFMREYRDVLQETIGINDRISQKIGVAQFTPEDLTGILESYHKAMGYDYEIIPPRVISSISAGAGPDFYSLFHTSQLNGDNRSTSLIGGLKVNTWITLFDNRVDVILSAGLHYGIIQHDYKYEDSQDLWTYYDDVIRVALLTPGLDIKLRPISLGRFSPVLIGGIILNTFLTSDRELTKELYFPIDEIVLTEFKDDFEKPAPFTGILFGGGVEYNYSRRISISVEYRYSIYNENSFGAEKSQGISIIINRSF